MLFIDNLLSIKFIFRKSNKILSLSHWEVLNWRFQIVCALFYTHVNFYYPILLIFCWKNKGNSGMEKSRYRCVSDSFWYEKYLYDWFISENGDKWSVILPSMLFMETQVLEQLWKL